MKKIIIIIITTLLIITIIKCNTTKESNILYVKSYTKINKYRDSLSLLVYDFKSKRITKKIGNINNGHLWDVIDNNIYTIDVDSIHILNHNSKICSKIILRNSYIESFTANNSIGYLVISNSEENVPYLGNIYKLDLNNFKLKKLNLEGISNIFGLNLSPSGRKISFLTFDNYDSENPIEFLKVYDFKTKSLITVDSVNFFEESMGDIDDPNLSCWITDNEITYIRCSNDYQKREMYSFNFTDNISTKIFEIPQKCSSTHQYHNGKFIFLGIINHRYKSILEIDIKSNKVDTLYVINDNSVFSSLDNFYILNNSID